MSSIKDNVFNTYNPLCSNDLYIESNDKKIKLNQLNFPNYVKQIYILCPLRINDTISELYYRYVRDKTYDSLSDYLILLESPCNILKETIHFSKIVSVKSKTFLQFNKFGYDLEEDIFILPILNIRYKFINDYLKLFNSYNLKDLYNIFCIGNYFGNSYDNLIVSKHLIEIITNLEESKYWTYDFNCLLNLNDLFVKNSKNRFTIKLLDLDKKKSDTNETYKNSVDYMQFVFQKNKNFKDISKIIKHNGMQLFKIDESCEFSKDDINNLFDKLKDEYQKYILFCYLLVSKKYTHLVINNKYILEKMSSVINDYASLFRYLIGYSWATLYYEECILKKDLSKDSRCVFDLYTAALLPIFPFNYNKPQHNPYMPIPISTDVLNPSNNIGGFPCYFHNDLKHKGLVKNKEEYMKRFNIYCTGNPNNNLFANFDFKKNKIGITGSIIAATVFVEPFLKPIFNETSAENDVVSKFDFEWNRYFAEYFCSRGVLDKNGNIVTRKSDIDIMIETDDDFEFIDKFYDIHNIVTVNIMSYNNYAEPNHIKSKILKTIILYVDYDFIKKYMCDGKLDVKVICCNLDNSKIIDLFLPFFKVMYKDTINKKFKDFSKEELDKILEKYPDYFAEENSDKVEIIYKIKISEKTNFNFVKFINSKSNLSTNEINEIIDNKYESIIEIVNQVIKNNKYKSDLKLYYNFKGYVKSPHINHQLEIYKIKNMMSTCSMHHFSWVRGYFDGDTVLCTTSCITGFLTGHTPDIRWHSCEAKNEETQCKWVHRGFGMYLNNTELNNFINYVKKNEFWSNLFDISKNDKNHMIIRNKKLTGLNGINSKIYRPRLYSPDYYFEAPFVDLTNAYNDKFCKNTYKHVMNDNLFDTWMKEHFKCLNVGMIHKEIFNLRTGFMNPLDLNLILSSYIDNSNKRSMNLNRTKNILKKGKKNIII